MDTELKKMKKNDLLKIISKMKKNDLINIIVNKIGGENNLHNTKNAIRQYIVFDEKKLKNSNKNNVMANDNIYENVE